MTTDMERRLFGPELYELRARIRELAGFVRDPWFVDAPHGDVRDAMAEVGRIRERLYVLRIKRLQLAADARLFKAARSWVQADAAETEATMLEAIGRSIVRCRGGRTCHHQHPAHRVQETMPQWVGRLRAVRDGFREPV